MSMHSKCFCGKIKQLICRYSLPSMQFNYFLTSRYFITAVKADVACTLSTSAESNNNFI